MDLLPNCLRQLENGGADRRGQIEVLVEGVRVLYTNPNSPCQISTVGVVPDLVALPKNMERDLPLEYLLYQVGNYV